MDTDGNGTLDRNEFNEGLIDLGIELRAQELDDLIDYFDHGGNGAITGKILLTLWTTTTIERRTKMMTIAVACRLP